MDPEAVGGEEGLAAALLITDEGVLSSVSLLVGAQVACCAIGSGTALKGALVPFYLVDREYLINRTKDFSSQEMQTSQMSWSFGFLMLGLQLRVLYH